jgi:hypothetical protein
MVSMLDMVVADSSLNIANKEERIAMTWSALPDLGATEALTALLSTENSLAAALAANHLALLPGLRAEKTRAAEHLLQQGGEWAKAGVNLIKFLPPDLIDDLIRNVFATASNESTESVVFEIAKYFPAHLQPFASNIESTIIGEALMAGGPDEWVDENMRRFAENEDPAYIRALVRIRTDKARNALYTLRATLPQLFRPAIDASLESSGIFADSGTPSIYPKIYIGLISRRYDSPHAVGGTFSGQVPFCEFCGAPLARVLSLSGAALGWNVIQNPSFFWFQCDCHDNLTEDLFVRLTSLGAERLVVIGIAEPGKVRRALCPMERSLVIEDHPNSFGIGSDRVPTRSQHEVGGPPNWCEIAGFPRCPECEGRLQYAAAFDGGMTPFDRIILPGTLFCFWCDGCAVSATRLQR